jgi:hypothetical protein
MMAALCFTIVDFSVDIRKTKDRHSTKRAQQQLQIQRPSDNVLNVGALASTQGSKDRVHDAEHFNSCQKAKVP